MSDRRTLIAEWALGTAYGWLGRYAEAEPLLIEALSAQRRVFGDDHIQTVRVRNSLANTYEKMGLDEDAAKLYPVQDRVAIEMDADALEASRVE